MCHPLALVLAPPRPLAPPIKDAGEAGRMDAATTEGGAGLVSGSPSNVMTSFARFVAAGATLLICRFEPG